MIQDLCMPGVSWRGAQRAQPHCQNYEDFLGLSPPLLTLCKAGKVLNCKMDLSPR